MIKNNLKYIVLAKLYKKYYSACCKRGLLKGKHMKKFMLSLIFLMSVPLYIQANEVPCSKQGSNPKCTVSRLCSTFGQTLKAFNTHFDKQAGLCVVNVESPLGKVKLKGAKNQAVKLSTFTFENTRSNAAGLVTGHIALRKKDVARVMAILRRDPKIKIVELNKRFEGAHPSDIRYLNVQASKDYIILFARTIRAALDTIKP
jgi:uncharacterized protein DUF1259